MQVLIIGYGSIGKRHAQILSSFPSISSITVVTRQLTDDFLSYPDLQSVPFLDHYDYIVIASETSLHYDHLMFFEQHTADKIILVEKPLFNRYQTVLTPKNKIFVAYNLRFHPMIQKLKELLSDQKILTANVIAGQYLPDWRPDRAYQETYSAKNEAGGGVLLDLSHELDYIRFLFGPLIHVEAANKKVSTLEIDSDDIVTGIGVTDTGVLVNFTMDYLSKIPIRKIFIQTESLTLIADLINLSLETSVETFPSDHFSRIAYDKNDSYSAMHQELLSLTFFDVCTLDEALQTMQTIEAIRQSEQGHLW